MHRVGRLFYCSYTNLMTLSVFFWCLYFIYFDQFNWDKLLRSHFAVKILNAFTPIICKDTEPFMSRSPPISVLQNTHCYTIHSGYEIWHSNFTSLNFWDKFSTTVLKPISKRSGCYLIPIETWSTDSFLVLTTASALVIFATITLVRGKGTARNAVSSIYIQTEKILFN